MARNWMKPGDRVRMKDGEMLTVKSLEFREFIAEERVGYIPKRDIEIVEEAMLCALCEEPISNAELCESCAKGNDPFFSSKYRGGYDRA